MYSMVEKAIEFAAIKHDGQFRKGTVIPYITHPFGVALLLQKEQQREEVIAAGVLHDTLEDTDTTKEELLKQFGEEVLWLVVAATEPSKSLPWEVRKLHTIEQLPFRSDEEVMLILADKLHNLRSIHQDAADKGEDVWLRFNREKRDQSWYYMGIVQAVMGRKKEIPLVRQLEREVCRLFIGKDKIGTRDIDALFKCAAGMSEELRQEMGEGNALKFIEEITVRADRNFKEKGSELIAPLKKGMDDRGLSLHMDTDKEGVLLAYLTELKHRLAWSDDVFFEHFKRNRWRM
ncbi:HD domain-containing protein [Planococcus salinus]|uniref:Bifunctional (P)ppGpp synthetase/guanosine-3',5'-bis(Diphosphate) 3'-pyrophosphohydrolase n=1 Tax=Planococcus salinus TaxID=1848460 RepID=A0A3M8P740_9BACL|nr:HD domain-containing protein [Planococcus salinus]RNF39483.1 bifunctional (p)ppGpp synthetase/guanosine-3',5'-bis(diphosphate) 3'-pyrophosphohydrolase [Planococcus salinus]